MMAQNVRDISVAQKNILPDAEYASITLQCGIEIRLIMKTRDDGIRAPYERILSPDGDVLSWSFIPTEGNIQQSAVPSFVDAVNGWIDYIDGDESLFRSHAAFEHALEDINE